MEKSKENIENLKRKNNLRKKKIKVMKKASFRYRNDFLKVKNNFLS